MIWVNLSEEEKAIWIKNEGKIKGIHQRKILRDFFCHKRKYNIVCFICLQNIFLGHNIRFEVSAFGVTSLLHFIPFIIPNKHHPRGKCTRYQMFSIHSTFYYFSNSKGNGNIIIPQVFDTLIFHSSPPGRLYFFKITGVTSQGIGKIGSGVQFWRLMRIVIWQHLLAIVLFMVAEYIVAFEWVSWYFIKFLKFYFSSWLFSLKWFTCMTILTCIQNP